MTAGRGIVHSERTPSEVRKAGGFLHGLQSWVALPKAFEEVEPSFQHHASKTLPEFSEKGVQLKLLVGTAFGQASPAQTYSDIFYIEAKMKAGQKIILPNPGRESAIYPIRGNAKVSGVDVAEGIMAVGKVNATLEIEALGDLHAVFLGGAPLDGNREIWWNFVSSSHERIERAKTEWRERQFPSIPGDDREFIPPPDA